MTTIVELTQRAEQLAAELALTLGRMRVEAQAPQPEPRRTIAPALLTAAEVGEALGMSRSSVYQLVGSGELASVQIGTRRRIPVQAVEAYVANLIAHRDG